MHQHAQYAMHLAPCFAGLGLCLLQQRQGFTAACKKQAAVAGERDAARGAQEQGHAQLQLQQRHRLADGRAGEPQGVSGGDETAALGGQDEGRQVTQVLHGWARGWLRRIFAIIARPVVLLICRSGS
jgi:hypothetical protein